MGPGQTCKPCLTMLYYTEKIVRSSNANTVKFDSDNEDDEYVNHAEAIREKRSKAGKPESVQVTRQVPHDYWEEENQRLEKLKRARLKQVREEEELQKTKLREAEEK